MNSNDVDRRSLAVLWRELSQITRAEIFGAEDERRQPLRNVAHASLPALGWIGRDYRSGGLAILAANPGGGGDKYVPPSGDIELYESFALLKAAVSDDDRMIAFETMNALYQQRTAGHNIALPLRAILAHGRLEPEQCAFLNVLPFRTRNDAWPGKSVRAKAIRRVASRQLQALRPARLVCLGMNPSRDTDRYLGDCEARIFRIPRVRGDRRLHPKALMELARLQADCLVSPHN